MIAGEKAPRLSTRPWWARIAVVVILACAVWLVVDAVADALFGAEYSLPSHGFRAVTTCAVVLVALALLLRWEGTRPSDYGLVAHGMPRGFASGVVGYLVPFLVAAAAILGLGSARVDVTADPLTVVGEGLLLLALVLLYEAVPEELIFRGHLYRVLAERVPVWFTVLGQALLFCAFGTLIGAAGTFDRVLLFFVFSLTLGWLRHVTGTVYATIGFHALFQLLAQWLLGERWGAVTLDDPQGWFALVALGIAPFAFAPLVAGAILRPRHA
jgi:membrane protease YdiL (CAAX protease family)